MSFALSVLRANGKPTPVIKVGENFWPLAEAAPGLIRRPEAGLLDLLENWEDSFARLRDVVSKLGPQSPGAILESAAEYDLLVTRPDKIVCAGMNYYDHLRKDAKREIKKEDYDPIFFLKTSSGQVASGRTIPFPSHTSKFDWEVELVIVFGKGGRNIKAADAMAHIAGYTVGNDLSARDWQFNPRHVRQFDLVAGKAFDNSAPVGPLLVPAAFVDVNDLYLKLWVNGELKQDSSTKEMIWSLGELIEAYTDHTTIMPGDMMFTGAPSGVGMATNTYLRPGDRIVAEIQGLGRLETNIAG